MGQVPALFGYCKEVFDKMWAEGKEAPEHEGRLWDGALTKLVMQDCNLSVPYYSKIKNALEDMDCMRQTRRGGGGSGSQWLLLRPPTEDLFIAMVDSSPKQTEKRDTDQRLKDLNERLSKVERAIGL